MHAGRGMRAKYDISFDGGMMQLPDGNTTEHYCEVAANADGDGAAADTAGQGQPAGKRSRNAAFAVVPLVVLAVFSIGPTVNEGAGQTFGLDGRRELQESPHLDDAPRGIGRLVVGTIISCLHACALYALCSDSAVNRARLSKLLRISSTTTANAVGSIAGNALPVALMLGYLCEYITLLFHTCVAQRDSKPCFRCPVSTVQN